MKTAIYKITNILNNKLYIGISSNPQKRWGEHRRHTKKTHTKLYNAFKKYGNEVFKFSILYWCDTRNEAKELEHLIVEVCETRTKGYNMCKGGGGGAAGVDNPNYGKHLAPEVCAKMSIAARNRPVKPETIEKGMAALRIKEHDKAWLSARNNKIKVSNLGREMSPEWRANLVKGWDKRRDKNITPSNAISVICNETQEIFHSASDTAKKYGISVESVCKQLRGKIPNAPKYGLTFSRY